MPKSHELAQMLCRVFYDNSKINNHSYYDKTFVCSYTKPLKNANVKLQTQKAFNCA